LIIVQPLVDFFLHNYPPARRWPDGDLLNYISWTAHNNFLFVSHDNDGGVTGIAFARPVKDFPKTDAEFDLNGKMVFVDAIAAANKRAFQILCYALLGYYKDKGCHTLTYHRLGRESKKKRCSIDRFLRTLFKTRN
jgi:hypothetical protein